jgi:hypothetical protein
VIAQLLYIQHGGSGLQLSYPAVMDMELSEILWWRRKLEEIRSAEAKAIKDASSHK